MQCSVILVIDIVCFPPVIVIFVVVARIQFDRNIKYVLRFKVEIYEEASEDEESREVKHAALRILAPPLGHGKNVKQVAATDQE